MGNNTAVPTQNSQEIVCSMFLLSIYLLFIEKKVRTFSRILLLGIDVLCH